MNVNDIVTTLLTSTAVSAIVSYVLKSLFESRLKHHFEKEFENLRQEHALELEKVKSLLAIEVATAHQLSERRLEAYPKLVELIYRTRNIAREISNTKEPSVTLSDEFTKRASELEEKLFAHRIDLERDDLFAIVHRYKNTIMSFHKLDRDLQHFHSLNDMDEVSNLLAQMKNLYTKVEKEHKSAINKLSTSKRTA